MQRIRRTAFAAAILLTTVMALPIASAVSEKNVEEYTESPFTTIYASDPAGGGTNDAQIAKSGEAVNVETVGHNDLGGGGFNADVWVHERGNGEVFAYVGQWGFGASQLDRCDPANRRGVKVVDVTDPTRPVVVSRLENPPLTTAEDVQVLPYGGRDIAMVGIQACFRLDPDIERGLQIFDVTDPRNPVQIGFLDTGVAARGVHEFWAVRRPDGRVIAILTVPFSDTRDAAGRGDIRIADVTDPTRPLEIADWGLRDEFSADQVAAMQNSGQGCFPFRFGHGADSSHDGKVAYVAYWDWGVQVLDISDPATPRFRGRTGYLAHEDGDAHSSNVSLDGRYLFQADEDLPPPGNCKAPAQHREAGWGYLRIFDISNPAQPGRVSVFKTPNSTQASRNRKGDYTVHNPVVVGNKVYLSWYTDGLRVVDISDIGNPRETARFVPPAAKDPQHILPFAAEVWGVVVDSRSHIYLSDMNSGLWIVREK